MSTIKPGTTVPRTVALQSAYLASFDVRPGVPSSEALEQASLYLASAYDMASSIAQTADGDGAWAVVYLIEMAKAVVDSVTAGLIRGEVTA